MVNESDAFSVYFPPPFRLISPLSMDLRKAGPTGVSFSKLIGGSSSLMDSRSPAQNLPIGSCASGGGCCLHNAIPNI